MEPPWLWFSIYITAPPDTPLPLLLARRATRCRALPLSCDPLPGNPLPGTPAAVRSNCRDRWLQGLADWLAQPQLGISHTLKRLQLGQVLVGQHGPDRQTDRQTDSKAEILEAKHMVTYLLKENATTFPY